MSRKECKSRRNAVERNDGKYLPATRHQTESRRWNRRELGQGVVKHFVYLRVKPATGKITTARILEKELGWKLFWFHDLKNAVYGIVKEHRIPRLMDELTNPVITYLLERGDDVIYVRPSPDKETVEAVHATLRAHPDYKLHVIRLEASYDMLLERAQQRDDPFRISNKTDLDEYIQSRQVVDVDGEHIIMTDGLSPEAIATKIRTIIEEK